jgi:hypothetical protein
MTSVERILVPKSSIFITTASGRAGKQELARNAGYSILSDELQYIASVASEREDALDKYLGLRVVAHHYRDNTGIPTTIQAAVNKTFAVHDCFDELRRSHSSAAIDLEGRSFTAHDNQRVLLKQNGHKIAFKKIRTGNPKEQEEDIAIIVDTMTEGSMNQDHVEFLSVFAESTFGHNTELNLKTVRTRVGRILPPQYMQSELMAAIIAEDGGTATGGIDIDILMSRFVDATEIDIFIRYLKVGKYHFVEFEGKSLILVDSLVQDHTKDRSIILPRDFNLNQHILPELVRGFTGSLI